MHVRRLPLLCVFGLSLAGCVSTNINDGFSFIGIPSSSCRVLAWAGEPVTRTASSGDIAMFATGNCPQTYPGTEVAIWTSQSITIKSPIVASVVMKRDRTGDVNSVTIRRSTGTFLYIWSKRR